MKKRKVFILIISLVLLIIIVLGVSYALLEKNIVGDNGKVIYKVGDLEVKLDESSAKDISLVNAIPTEDSNGLNSEPYSFSLVNNGSQRLKYTIYLEDDTAAKNKCGTDCELIPYNFIKYNLSSDSNSLKMENLSSSSTELYTGTINSKATDKFNLRVWLSIAADNTAMNKYYFGKIRVEVTYISNEDLKALCLSKGGDKIIDDKCYKYYALINNFSDIASVEFGYNGNDGYINRNYNKDTKVWTVSYKGNNKWFGTRIEPNSESVTHKYYARFKSTSPSHGALAEFYHYEGGAIYPSGTITKMNDNFYSAYFDLSNIDSNKITDYGGFLLYHHYPTTTTPSDTYYLSDYIVIDLTLMFGKGNEPDKDWCDKNLTGNITYNKKGIKIPISEINYKEKTSYYDVIDLFN